MGKGENAGNHSHLLFLIVLKYFQDGQVTVVLFCCFSSNGLNG